MVGGGFPAGQRTGLSSSQDRMGKEKGVQRGNAWHSNLRCTFLPGLGALGSLRAPLATESHILENNLKAIQLSL